MEKVTKPWLDNVKEGDHDTTPFLDWWIPDTIKDYAVANSFVQKTLTEHEVRYPTWLFASNINARGRKHEHTFRGPPYKTWGAMVLSIY